MRCVLEVIAAGIDLIADCEKTAATLLGACSAEGFTRRRGERGRENQNPSLSASSAAPRCFAMPMMSSITDRIRPMAAGR